MGGKHGMAHQQHDVYPVDIAGIKRNLTLFEVAPGVRIAVLNILGDTELIQAAAKSLAEKLRPCQVDVIVTAEAKSIPLAYALAVEMNCPWVILRKNYKPYMGEALQAETLSITTGKPQTLYLDEKDGLVLKGKRIALVDDVISTGSTLQSMHNIVSQAGGSVIAQAAVFTEGDRSQWQDIIALGHLPVFTSE
jgi:adenine phosphoribosyltransferase